MNIKKSLMPWLTFRVAAETAARQSCSQRHHGEVLSPCPLPRCGWEFLRRRKGIGKRGTSMVHAVGDAVRFLDTCSAEQTNSDLVLLIHQQMRLKTLC